MSPRVAAIECEMLALRFRRIGETDLADLLQLCADVFASAADGAP